MILPTIPDLNWITEQIREIMVYFKSFSVVHYSYRSFFPVRLKDSWRHLCSDQYIRDIFDQAESDSGRAEQWRRVGYALLQWRPLILHFRESFAFARKYKALGRKLIRNPAKRSIHLLQLEDDFEYIRSLYINSGRSIGQSPENVFFPAFTNRSPNILDLCSRFLTKNTEKYKLQDGMDEKHFIQLGNIAQGFQFQQWKRVLPFLHDNLRLKVPKNNNYNISHFKKGGYAWTFPVFSKNNPEVKKSNPEVKIAFAATSGPTLLKIALHETGHGIHYLNMAKKISSLDYFLGDSYLTETIAYVFERLGTNPTFITDVWKCTPRQSHELTTWCKRLINYQTQKNAMDLKYRIELFSKGWNILEAQEIYQDYLRKYMGLSIVAVNNFQFAFRPFLPGDYFLANLHATNLIQNLKPLF